MRSMERTDRAGMGGYLRSGALALALTAGAAFGQGEARKWAVLELDGPVLEAPEGFEWLFGAEKPLFREMIDSVREARTQDLGGIVVQVKDLQLTGTQIEELGAALRHVREGGAKVHVFAENYGPAELMLGAYADQVVMQSGGSVTLPGMHMEEMFLADTLGWVGVKADFVQVGDYKGASEMFARNAPSPTWDESINTMLDGLYANQRATLKAGRKLDDAGLDAAMKTAWMAAGQSAIQAKLIDAQIDLPELPSHLEKTIGAKVSWAAPIAGQAEQSLDMSNPFALLAKLGQQPDNTPTGPTIAVVHITGSIVDGESTAGGLLGGSSVGSRTIRKALSEIEKQELVKGVVVRIDSPGGSATASEMIWQGLRRVAKTKPVYVSIGSMAASGGYYIAVGGDRIFANPSSIVGSIGVVGGKFVMQGLYDMVKAGVVERSRGPMASMMSTKSLWTPQERELVRQKMTETYELFTSRVTAGRPGIDLKRTAEGRLFAGTQALDLKMIDQIGGLHDAVEALATELGLEEYELRDYPGPRSLDEMLKGILPGMASAPIGGASPSNAAAVASVGLAGLEAIMGPRAFAQVRSQLSALMQMREERVMLVMPRILVIK